MQIKPFTIESPVTDVIGNRLDFFERVKQDYPDFAAKNYFRRLPDEGLMLYRIQKPTGVLRGVVGCAAIREYTENRIKGHEHTIRKEEDKQVALLRSRGSAIKPILLTYPDVPQINEWVVRFEAEQPLLFELQFGAEQHRFWAVTDVADIKQLQKMFADYVPNSYIADGHHRAASTALFAQGNNISGLLSLWAPASQLEIWAFHRVIMGYNRHTPATILAALLDVCDISSLRTGAELPGRAHQMTMCLDNKWYKLDWKTDLMPQNSINTDVALLNTHILGPILGITDVRSDPRVRYVEGISGLSGLQQKIPTGKKSIAFAMHPISITDIMQVADAGLSLPPKSTWFEPRVKNGVIVYPF